MKFISLWTYLSNIGIDAAALGREVIKARLLNQLIFIALFTSILTLFTYFFFFDGYLIIYTTMANIILELIGVVLISYKQHSTVRFIAVFIFPTLIAFNVHLVGGNFGEENIFLALAFAGFILYDGKRMQQFIAVIYIAALFTASKLYTIQHVYEQHFNYNPYDEIITFPMILFVLGLIIFLYQKELREYEKEKNQLIADLEGKNRTLFQINNELEQFTYIASHDLKTPLRTVSSHLDLIKLHLARGHEEALEKDMFFAKKGVRQMYRLIDDILEYKKFGRDASEFELVDLNTTVREVQDNLAHLLKEKNGRIISSGLPQLYMNKGECIALFQNLIENGLKYNTAKEPLVKISCAFTADHLVISFKDNGIGIRAEYHEKIFSFFKRLHTTDDYEGSGIGLGLCKKIAKKYKGDIHVSSNEGSGAVFQVVLPKSLMNETIMQHA
jgi:signal transduction histidine kinase